MTMRTNLLRLNTLLKRFNLYWRSRKISEWFIDIIFISTFVTLSLIAADFLKIQLVLTVTFISTLTSLKASTFSDSNNRNMVQDHANTRWNFIEVVLTINALPYIRSALRDFPVSQWKRWEICSQMRPSTSFSNPGTVRVIARERLN